MVREIIGQFYFKKTSNGNLFGEWSNNDKAEIFSESCDLIKAGNDIYLGEYISTWQENGKPISAKLTITRKQNNSPLFFLKWHGNKFGFEGEGMLCDDILIGRFHEV
jgi:hypothetical protein